MPEVRRCIERCGREAVRRSQRCEECRLRRQSPIARLEASQRRLALIPEVARRPKVDKKLWPEGRRWCAGCQTFILVEDCAGSRCKACASAARHKSATASRFGIDGETYQWLLDRQGGKCAICRCRPRTVRFAVDHAHDCEVCGGKTGCPECVRGLLCSRCNSELLGAAHDSIHILRNAVAYLEQWPMRGEWTIPQYEIDQWQAEHPGESVPPF